MGTRESSSHRLARAANLAGRLAGHHARIGLARLRLVPTWDGYTRLLIVGKGRSGTNFLRLLLADHPGVVAYGELLRDHARPDGGIPMPLQSGWARRQKLADPVRFIEQRVFRPLPRRVQAVGFKLFYYHAREPDWQVVWDHLAGDERVRVLHMVRRDDLATLVSLHRAEQSGRWLTASTAGMPQLVLSPEECEESFRQTRAWREALAGAFPPDRVHEVGYEDLRADPAAVMARVQRYLGLDVQPLTAGSVRQSRGSTADAVANFEALRDHFAGTPWEGWLGERSGSRGRH